MIDCLFKLKEILINSLKDNDSLFDSIDYYGLTDIPLNHIALILEKNVGLNYEEKKLLSVFIHNSMMKMTVDYTNVELFKIARLNEYQVISGIEITSEMKLNAIDYLLCNNYPIDFRTYNDILRRMVRDIKLDMGGSYGKNK